MTIQTRVDETAAESAPAGGTAPLSTWAATLLVAEREIVSQVRSKSFIISNALTLLLIIGGIVLASVIGGRDSATQVAVVGDVGPAVSAAQTLEVVPTSDASAAEQLLRDDEVEAIIVADDSVLGFHVVALEDAPGDVVSALAVSPEVELLEPASTSSGLRSLVSLAFGLAFMATAVGSGAMIMQNTVQEKQSRVVEILLAAVPAHSLMAGKILGNSVIGVGTAVAMAAASALGLLVTGQTELLGLLSMPMIWFVIFFIFGFVLVASVFAAGAALVSRQEDVGSVMMPAMMLIMIPYFGVAFFSSNQLVMTILSYVPFSAPVAMPVRMFLGEATWWEPLISLVLLIACTVVVAAVAAKIYTGSLLRMGGRVSLREALRQQ